MKRVHVLEFEDLDWFPTWLRAAMTHVLVVLARKLGIVEVIAGLVERAIEQSARRGGGEIDCIVDLGSGSGGVMPEVVAGLRRSADTADVRLVMTDLHPSPEVLEAFGDDEAAPVRYQRAPVDATDLASAPPGLKTMINSFHHMRPPQARAIVESAHRSRQPLLIYEMGDNEMPFWLWCLLLPLALPLVALTTLVLTPFVRPLSARQLLLTYLVPIIPLFYAWDGQASVPRIYTLRDLDELLEGLQTEDYRWEKGYAKTAKGRKLGIYLLGMPVDPSAEA